MVALLADVDHSTDDFVLDEERVEAEVGEFLREIIWWGDRHATEVRHFLFRGLGR